MIKKILEILYSWSSKLNVWSWQKLYGNRATGFGYKENEWIKGYKKWKKR